MSKPCYFCGESVNPFDVSTWKQVIGWVHGKRKDGMTLREDTENVAHDHCVTKARAGQSVDQPDLFGEDAGAAPEVSDVQVPALELVRFLDNTGSEE